MMEAEGPLARVERTLWTVWAFFSEAVNRLIRPLPPPGVGGEHGSAQQPAGEGEPPDSRTGEDPAVTVSPLHSRQTVDVEQVLTEDNCQADVAAENEPDQTRRDDSELLVAEDAKGGDKGESPMPSQNNEIHKEHMGSKALAGDAISEEARTVAQVKRQDDDKATPEHQRRFETAESERDQCTVTPEEGGVTLKEDGQQEGGGGVVTREEAGGGKNVLQVDQNMEAGEEAARDNDQLVSHGDRRDVADGEKREPVVGPGSENDEAVWSPGGRAERADSQENVQTPGEDDRKDEISSEHLAGSDSTVPSERSQHSADSLRFPQSQGFSEMIQANTAATVKLEGETRREMSRELESIPLGSSEGRAVMLEELNAPACEETQDGLPENNNELGQDENTTRRFLEAGDYKESQSARLPEEVEISEQESPQNAEAAGLPMTDFVEESRGSAGDPETVGDLAEVEPSRTLPRPDGEFLQETEEKPFEEASGDFDRPLKTELSEGPMKEIRDSRALDGTEPHLFGFAKDEALSGSDDAVGNGHQVKGSPAEEWTKFTDETLKAGAREMTQELPHMTRDGTANSEATESNAEGVRRREPSGVEHEMQGLTKTQPLAPTECDLITGGEEEEHLIKDALSTQVETEGIQHQSPQRTFEVEMGKVIRGSEGADDVTTAVTEAEELSDTSSRRESESLRRHAEGLSGSITSHQDLLDEEILDLWIETAMSSSSQQNSQDDSLEEIEAPDLLNRASVARTRSGPGSEVNTRPMCQNSRTTQGEEEEMETRSREDFDEEANGTAGTQTQGSAVPMSSPAVLTESATSESSDEVAQSVSGESRSGSPASSEERRVLTRRCSGSQKEQFQDLSTEEQKLGGTAENSPNGSAAAFHLHGRTEVDAPVLDFTPQRFRISLKNPRVRAPTNPRYLLNMPSLEPTLSSPTKPPAGLPVGGLGIGIKLPGLAAGFPPLKKTQQVVKDERETSQEAEDKPEEKGDPPGKEETTQKAKWTPPKHPGFGNPLMSELKNKLKKTSNE